MSTLISLIQMPNVVIKNIFKYLDFQSILILRKVCHDLRNFIDDTKPASRLTGIRVFMNPIWVSFNLCLPRSASSIGVNYLDNGEGCLIKWEKEGKVKKTMMENEDFVAVFCKDLDIILRHQKTVLEYFNISFHLTDCTVKKRVLGSLNKSLSSMKHPLQVKSLHMGVNDQNDILTILPYIDPKPLERIHINDYFNSRSVLYLDRIGQLEQWKQAKELIIQGLQLPNLPQNLIHFSRINFGFEKFRKRKEDC